MKKQSKTIEIASPPSSEDLPAVVKINLLPRNEGLGMQANATPCLENLRYCCAGGICRPHRCIAIQKRKNSPPGCRSLKGK
jgi:hypothetical protein